MANIHDDLCWPDGRRVKTGQCFGVDWFWTVEDAEDDEDMIGKEGFGTEAEALEDARRTIAGGIKPISK